MTLKIKQLQISGIRGVRKDFNLQLDERSVLFYGDNGTGKSSISDALEWFYTEKVSHLSMEGLDFKEAIRNFHVPKEDDSSISITYSRGNFNNERKLYYKKDKLIQEFASPSEEHKKYISESNAENLLLRYQALRDFVDKTKTDKLKQLSEIIGFSEVTKVKDVLKKGVSHIKSEIKAQNFENQINSQKQVILEKIGALASVEKNFIEQVKKLIEPLNTGISLSSIADIDSLLDHLKSKGNEKLIAELQYIEKCTIAVSNLQNEVDFIDNAYTKYYQEFNAIALDVNSIMQTYLAELLKIGDHVIDKKYHKEDTCPLCLQSKSLSDLQSEIKIRLKNIEESSKKKEAYDQAKEIMVDIAEERLKRLDMLVNDPFAEDYNTFDLRAEISNLKVKIESYLSAGKEKVTSGNALKATTELKLSEEDFAVLKKLEARKDEVQSTISKDNTMVVFANVSAARDAFVRISELESQKQILESQKQSLETVYNEFVRRQKEGLQSFIDSFSDKINEFYQFMNPGEPFEEIKIITIGEEDELNGLTVEYKFNNTITSPPQKYFSESHLNCFGISFFLASVLAFNKVNKFLIFDDVISSFDTTHRKRFSDLLFEKFSDWQIIILTHEENWFQLIRALAKRKGWLIGEIGWSEEKGTYIEESIADLKASIEAKIKASDISMLGNPMRKYLEHTLKSICYDLEVKVSFKYNDVNEKRMADELLNELRHKIRSHSNDLKTKAIPILDRVISSSLLGNLLSHDNPFNPKIGDLKAFWADVTEFETVFLCQEPTCKKPRVSLKNYDTVAKKIRCGCDATKYDWKD